MLATFNGCDSLTDASNRAYTVTMGSAELIRSTTRPTCMTCIWGAGNALIGLWLLGVNHSALKGDPWPYNLIILGLVSGVFLVLGLVAIPSIAHGCTSVGSLPALCASY